VMEGVCAGEVRGGLWLGAPSGRPLRGCSRILGALLAWMMDLGRHCGDWCDGLNACGYNWAVHRSRRWFREGVTVLSLLACFGVVGLWIRGVGIDDELFINVLGRRCIVGSFPSHVDLIIYRRPVGPRWTVHLYPGTKRIPWRPEYREVRFTRDWEKWELAAPWWLLFLFTIALPLWGSAAAVRRKRRSGRHACVQCGYDLRASSGRCPECGRRFETNKRT
jgi:hypothetical protein